MNRTVVLITVIAAALLITAGCSKKTIETEPYGSPTYSAAANRETTAGAEAGSGGPGQGVQEESLAAAGERSQMLSTAAVAAREDFENQDIRFEFDSAVLTEVAQEILRSKARWLQANPGVRVIIEGHCDERGTNEYNLALGERRARNAQKFLAELGIDPSRISTVSYGEERPLVTGSTEEARAKNRRAHFVIES